MSPAGDSGGRHQLDDEHHPSNRQCQEQQDDGDDGEGAHRVVDDNGSTMTGVRFLTRKVCRICTEALPVVESRSRRRRLAFEVVDVDDAGLAAEYGDRVPVVLLDGVEVLSGRFSARDVRRVLR